MATSGNLKDRLRRRWEDKGRRAGGDAQGGDGCGAADTREPSPLRRIEAETPGHGAEIPTAHLREEDALLVRRLGSLKEEANRVMKVEGDMEAAEKLYTDALEMIAAAALPTPQEDGDDEDGSVEGNAVHGVSGDGDGGDIDGNEREMAKRLRREASVLHSNRSRARIEQRRWLEASSDALKAAELQPKWAKPYYRMAQCKCGLGDYRGAMSCCRRGEALLEQLGDKSGEFGPLMEQIALQGVAHGSLAGFDGRLLLVRSAGEEAWLGRSAPENPLIDEAADETSLRADQMLSSSEWDSMACDGDSAAAWLARERAERDKQKPCLSFRSIREALEAAKDGDRVLILRGIHNTGGSSVFVDKRVAIRGEGTMEETTIDHRGNCPVFRITRNAVLQNLDIDMTGFRESVLVHGGPLVCPVIENCRFKCSGDGAIDVAGKANPIIRKCSITACKKAGLKLFEDARGQYIDLKISGCEQQGVKVMENAHGKFHRCYFTGNKEEGVVVMDHAFASLRECRVDGNGGPGIDVSGNGKLTATETEIKDNVGGVWLWEESKASLLRCLVEGGKSHVVLADGDCLPRVEHSTLEGLVQATDEAWEGIWSDTNRFIEPEKPVELPAENGPFKFEPIWYQRKQ